MSKKIFTVFLFLITVFSSAAQDRELSNMYVEYAIAAYDQNRFDDALSWVEKAVVFDECSSDALYLKSQIIKDIPGKLYEYQDLLKKSVTYKNWNRFNKQEVIVKYGKINQRLMDYKATIEFFSKLKRSDLYNNEFLIYIYAEALIKTGQKSKALPLLKEAVKYFYESSDLWKLLISIDKASYLNVRAQLLTHSNTFLYSLYEYMIAQTADKVLRKKLIDSYYNLDMESFSVKAASYGLLPRISWWDVKDIMKYKQPETRKEMEMIISLVDQNKLIVDFEQYWYFYSGILENDINNDGYSDSFEEYQNGKLKKAVFDTNQDGEPESIILINENGKIRLIFQGKYIQEIKYDVYPFVYAVKEYEDSGIIHEYVCRPGQLKLDYINTGARDFDPVKVNGSYLDLSKYKKYIIQINSIEEGSNGSRKEYVKLPYGVAEEYILTDNKIITEKKYLVDNKISRIEYDKNRDGIIETVMHYKDNKPAYIESDLNKNGIYEYKENLTGEKQKLWDINEDGKYDISESSTKNKIVRKFSTKFNGIFDIIMQVERGDIVKIFKNGIHQTLTRDKYGQYWIGKMHDIDIPDGIEGVYLFNMHQYFIFFHNDKIYIEVIIEKDN